MKTRSKVIIGLLIVGILCGIGFVAVQSDKKKKTEVNYQKLIDAYAESILWADENSRILDEALASVGVYIEKLTPETLEEAQKTVQLALDNLNERLENRLVLELDEEMIKVLSAYEVSYEEFQVEADADVENLLYHIYDLENLAERLSYEETDDLLRETLIKNHDMIVRSQDVLRRYKYYSINYWFAPLEEKALEYLEEKVLGKLNSFYIEMDLWDTNREDIEKRANLCMDEMDQILAEWAALIGEEQEELYGLEKQIDELKNK